MKVVGRLKTVRERRHGHPAYIKIKVRKQENVRVNMVYDSGNCSNLRVLVADEVA
jgi:hypothetical protein